MVFERGFLPVLELLGEVVLIEGIHSPLVLEQDPIGSWEVPDVSAVFNVQERTCLLEMTSGTFGGCGWDVERADLETTFPLKNVKKSEHLLHVDSDMVHWSG